MDRFPQQNAATLATNYALSCYLRLNHEDPPAPEIELPTCEGCGEAFAILQSIDAGFPEPLACCPACVIAFGEQELDCECTQIDVDLFDASYCALHSKAVA